MHPKARLEALLFAWGDPLTEGEIADALSLRKEEVQSLLGEYARELEAEESGLRLVRTENSYQLSTKPQLFSEISDYAQKTREKHLTNAALETLSIVAYRQPVLKAEIEEIRGVRCDQVLKNLQEADLVRILGKREIVGRPNVYGTTEFFLKKFGLESLEDLPKEGTEEQNFLGEV